MDEHYKKVILVIRDGWGYRDRDTDNAIGAARTPVDDRLMKDYPHTLLDASGEAVGLPAGYQGNSEVGHLTIGSGRIIYQSLVRIQKAIDDGSFFTNRAFLDALEHAKKNSTTLHLVGLLQAEGVHSHINHLFALLDLCAKEGFHDVALHVITDGRDSPPTQSLVYLKQLQDKLDALGFGTVATLSGRYFTMDRNKYWDRTKKAYECIITAQSDMRPFTDPIAAVQKSHKADVTDEFIEPIYREGYTGVHENDSIIFFNFRTDRPRQLTRAIVEEEFEGWERRPLKVHFVAMTQFYRPMDAHVAFGEQNLEHLLGEIISQEGRSQLRISETEKYAHVTFFFNGQREQAFDHEERIMIESPKVATYDREPEMSASLISEELVKQITEEKHDFIVVNLVNGDMVGHTGITPAIIKGVEAVDTALGHIIDSGSRHGYTILVCADHGNAEDQTPQHKTSHTTNKVPFILVSDDPELKRSTLQKDRGLQDIAPTVLTLMDIPVPSEMTGESLFIKDEENR